jgi:hypothetical protein
MFGLASDTDVLQMDARFGAAHSVLLRAASGRPYLRGFYSDPCYPCNPRLIPLRGQGGDDFFEAEIGTQRVQGRRQF